MMTLNGRQRFLRFHQFFSPDLQIGQTEELTDELCCHYLLNTAAQMMSNLIYRVRRQITGTREG